MAHGWSALEHLQETPSRLRQLQSVTLKAAPASVQHPEAKPVFPGKIHKKDMSIMGQKQAPTRPFSKGFKIRYADQFS